MLRVSFDILFVIHLDKFCLSLFSGFCQESSPLMSSILHKISLPIVYHCPQILKKFKIIIPRLLLYGMSQTTELVCIIYIQSGMLATRICHSHSYPAAGRNEKLAQQMFVGLLFSFPHCDGIVVTLWNNALLY